MANTEIIAGVHDYLLYGEETTYGTSVSTATHLGLLTSFRSTVENNITIKRGFMGTATTAREGVDSVVGTVDVSFSTDFDVVNWAFMEFVLGAVSGSTTLTYVPDDAIPSVTLTHNLDNPGSTPTDRKEYFPGSVFNSCTIRCATGSPVSVTLDGMSKTIGYNSTLSTAVANISSDGYTFAGGDIEVPDASSISNIIDSIEISINNNWEMLKGCGSRLTQRVLPKELAYEVRFTLKYINDDFLNKALGAASPTATGGPTSTSITLKFTSGSRDCEFRFTNVQFDWTQNAAKTNPLIEDITGYPQNLTVVEIV